MVAKILLFFCSLLVIAVTGVNAQPVVNAGRTFAFGIPEGPDRQVDSTLRSSRIFLTFLGTTEGCALIEGPSGFSASVNFTGTREREIEIPNSYMQKWEEGFNRKGFVVRTTQPAHVELHVVFQGASESTQIFPMEILDGNYVLSGWSLWNDVPANENNRAQFLITAAEDNTDVTITVPNGLLPNIPPGTTFNVKLNAGECYVGKMDSTLNFDLTTTQVLVKASKPVNVMQANTCGYVPFGVQSCNMLLDNVLPRKYFDQKFYVQPISRDVKSDHFLLTSDRMNFSAITTDGTFYQTNNGRLDIIIDKPSMIETDAPVMCQLLTPGSSQASLGLSDPTWVTVPPAALWDDTLKWYAPPPLGNGESFVHSVMIAGPQSAFNDIMVDGQMLSALTTMNPVPTTNMFTVLVGVPQGDRILRSKEPVSAIASGIASSDAYSLLPGGTLPNRYQPRPAAQVDLAASSATFCKELSATLSNSLTLSANDHIIEADATIKYDPAVLRVLSAVPGAFFQSIPGATIDVSTLGELSIHVTPGTYLTGDGSLIEATFAVDGDVSTSTLSGSVTLTNDEICDNARTFNIDVPVEITKTTESGTASISLSDFSAQQGERVTTDLIVADLQLDAEVSEFDVTLDWDRDLIEVEQIISQGTQSANWTIGRFDESPTQLRLHFTAAPGEFLANGKLASLGFKAFLSDVVSTEVAVAANLSSNRKCPLTLSVPDSKAIFNTDLLCGDSILVNVLSGRALVKSLSPNPARASVRIDLAAPSTGRITLIDVLSRIYGQWSLSGQLRLDLDIPPAAGSGSYILRLESAEGTQNLPLLIQK
jgi:hypothetical protein